MTIGPLEYGGQMTREMSDLMLPSDLELARFPVWVFILYEKA